MDTKQYIELAKKTESVPAELKINETFLHASLLLAVSASNVMDKVKRRLYYGKPLTIESMDADLGRMLVVIRHVGEMLVASVNDEDKEMSEANQPIPEEVLLAAETPEAFRNMRRSNLNVRLLHTALGGFTENGEKLEALLKQFETGNLDLVNFSEENGDTKWYDAIELDELAVLAEKAGLDTAQFTEAGIRIKNITKLQGNEKLKGRYSAGDFDAVEALNRDLANERRILESVAQLRAGKTVAVVEGADGNFEKVS